MKIEAGKLRETVAVQAGTDTTDAGGGLTRVWAAVTGKNAVRMHIIPISGREALYAEKLGGVTTHRVTLRYDSGITRNHRLLWGTRVLNILRVDTWDTKLRWMTLECAEAV